MKEHDLNEVDLRQDTQRIRLRRGPENVPMMTLPPGLSTTSSGTPSGAGDAPSTPETKSDNAVFIISPTVGTFYNRPSPDTSPFVKVGDVVSSDTVVCLVEAMKMYNEITAGVSGKIIACLVNNEEAVDVNKPLFKVIPS
jgi:acetyl-CoA carboxylase biotin carboxyl carrier protein